MMARRVQRLRLDAPSSALVGRGTFLLEDALRTASLPEPGPGRLVVRRLDVGAFDASISPQALSRQLERRFTELASSAVHLELATASSEAVRCRDAEQPYLLAARRLSRRSPLDAWFWPLAAPPLEPNQSPRATARALLAGILKTAAASDAAGRLLEVMIEAGDPSPLLDGLEENDGAELLAGLRREIVPQRAAAMPASSVTPRPAADPSKSMAPWIQRWGKQDPRSRWVIAVLRLAERPHRVTDPLLLASVDAALARCFEPSPPDPGTSPARRSRDWSAVGKSTAPRADADRSLEIETEARQEPRPKSLARAFGQASFESPWSTAGAAPPTGTEQAGTSQAQTVVDEPVRRRPERGGRVVEGPREGQNEPSVQVTVDSWPEAGLETEFAGLFFLLRPLERLGLPEWIQRHSGALDVPLDVPVDLPMRILDRVAAELGAAEEDPVRVVLKDRRSESPKGASELRASDLHAGGPGYEFPGYETLSLRDGSESSLRSLRFSENLRAVPKGQGKVARDFSPGRRPSEETSTFSPRGWIERLRNGLQDLIPPQLRAEVQDPLRPIVCRPGRLLVTRSHLDVIFDPSQADIWLRRSGLDIDPGWLPFFGRVVSFHYHRDSNRGLAPWV